MILYDWIFIGILVVAALIGMGIGFGRSLALFTGGIFGVIICVAAAFMIGGTFNNIDFVIDFIKGIDDWFTRQWNFLKYLKLGTVCYYALIFVLLQIVRLVIVRLLKQIDKIPSMTVRIINKTLGTVFMAAFMLGFALILLAGLNVLGGTSFAQNIIEKFENGFLHTLYINNPIKF